MGEGRLWERLRIYSGKYLFNKSKFYLEKFLILFMVLAMHLSHGRSAMEANASLLKR